MLRTARPRSEISISFVCYRCLSNLQPGPRENARLRRLGPRHQNVTAGHMKPSRSFGANSYQRSNTTAHDSSAPAADGVPPPIDTQQIRLQVIESLRQWEAGNVSKLVPVPEITDYGAPGEIHNALTRHDNGSFTPDRDVDDTNEESNAMLFIQEDLVDVGNFRLYLRPGDLVELLSMGGQGRELAICLNGFGGRYQFYTMSGSWVVSSSNSLLFAVSHFVEPHELDDLQPYIPASDGPAATQDELNGMLRLIPRSIGHPLLRKMLDFWATSDAVYQANSARLDTAHAHVAYPRTFRYATLDEIASVLLPEMVVNAEDHKIPYPALYAVHRAIHIQGVGFNTPIKRPLRAGGHYEIISRADMSNIELVRSIVREYMDSKFAKISGVPNALERFVAKAQWRIDMSRKSRPFTPYGTIGPVSTKVRVPRHDRSSRLKGAFDQTDMKIIQFIELWAALGFFNNSSPLNGIGSAILRAVERYGEDDVTLGKMTGWTLLQELGVIPPWESRAAYFMRLPNTGLRLAALPAESTQGLVSDKLESIRQDWGELPVYCIDDSDAREIDDGISIEPSDISGQYWVHIHTADPAAHIDPESPVAQYARTLGETVYMPDRVVTMLPSSYVKANLSLGPNRPCLTYSAKMDTNGTILDYKVTPGIIRNVHYLSPRVMEEVVLKSTYSKKNNFHQIGPDAPLSKRRLMIQSHDLSDPDKENFRLIHEIGVAHTRRRLARGAISPRVKDYYISVSTNGIQPSATKDVPMPSYYYDDPSIQILTEVIDSPVAIAPDAEFFDGVQPLMLIAGEVAARWCKDRGIPVIHRVTPRNEDMADPAEFFTKHVLPTMDERGDFDLIQQRAYFTLLGSMHLSTTPGPHIAMGLDMFARCTSPLRRYPDLLLQWQIESAILEEARLGKSLVGNTQDAFLPYSRAQIDELLTYIDGRSRLIQFGARIARGHWFIHFILRAWAFGEGEIPKTFSFVVTAVGLGLDRDTLGGRVDHFHLRDRLMCRHPDWATTELKIGDILEVEILDVNVYNVMVEFHAIRILDQSEKEALDRKNSLMMQSQEII